VGVGWAAPANGGVASWLRGTSFTGLVGPALSLLLGSGPGMSCIECVCARKAPGFAWSDGTSPATSTNSCSFRIIFLVGGTILPGHAAAASTTV